MLHDIDEVLLFVFFHLNFSVKKFLIFADHSTFYMFREQREKLTVNTISFTSRGIVTDLYVFSQLISLIDYCFYFLLLPPIVKTRITRLPLVGFLEKKNLLLTNFVWKSLTKMQTWNAFLWFWN